MFTPMCSTDNMVVLNTTMPLATCTIRPTTSVKVIFLRRNTKPRLRNSCKQCSSKAKSSLIINDAAWLIKKCDNRHAQDLPLVSVELVDVALETLDAM